MGTTISKALVFQPPGTRQEETQTFWLRTRRGSSIEALYVDRQCEYTVLFSHANAEDVHMITPWLRELARRCGVNAMAYSYTGYARSVGTPTELDVYADADAAWEWLIVRKGFDAGKIFLYGRSIGSGPATYLGERLSKKRTPPAGLVLQSPVLSVFRVALNFRITVPGDMFPNVDRVTNIACPVFVIHGEKDEVVPLWHGEGLWLATPITWRYEPFWIPDAGHNNIELLLRDSGDLFRRLSAFFTHCASPAIAATQRDFFQRADRALLQNKPRRRHHQRHKEPSALFLVFSCSRCGGNSKGKKNTTCGGGFSGGGGNKKKPKLAEASSSSMKGDPGGDPADDDDDDEDDLQSSSGSSSADHHHLYSSSSPTSQHQQQHQQTHHHHHPPPMMAATDGRLSLEQAAKEELEDLGGLPTVVISSAAV